MLPRLVNGPRGPVEMLPCLVNELCDPVEMLPRLVNGLRGPVEMLPRLVKWTSPAAAPGTGSPTVESCSWGQGSATSTRICFSPRENAKTRSKRLPRFMFNAHLFSWLLCVGISCLCEDISCLLCHPSWVSVDPSYHMIGGTADDGL